VLGKPTTSLSATTIEEILIQIRRGIRRPGESVRIRANQEQP
jgi:hypothetical protein